jgi:hypothetical protein
MNRNFASGPQTSAHAAAIEQEAYTGLTAAATPGNPSINPGVFTLAAELHSFSQIYAADRQPTSSQYQALITDGSVVTANCPKVDFSRYGIHPARHPRPAPAVTTPQPSPSPSHTPAAANPTEGVAQTMITAGTGATHPRGRPDVWCIGQQAYVQLYGPANGWFRDTDQSSPCG